MTMFTKILAGATGLAAVAVATPASAQYYGYQNYGYAQPGYAQPYGNAYGYRANNASNMAVQRCTAAVQARLNQPRGLSGILGAALGAQTNARVLQVTQVNPNRRSLRVRGLASSGANYGYGQYGYGAYGATAYGYQPDLSFGCTVDYRGYVTDVDINRRR